MSRPGLSHGMGWIPDHPDHRDYTPKHDKIKPLLTEANVQATTPKRLPEQADLEHYFPPVEDQGELGSCTAQAGVGLFEYFERRSGGDHTDASRLFLYKVTRNLLGLTGDTGAYPRTTIGAMVLFGVPPEKYYPYAVDRFDDEPTAFLYSFAENYKAMQYYRLDELALDTQALLVRIKYFIASGFPLMFGFSVYASISQAEKTGEIPFPSQYEGRVGGHAVIAMGYQDDRRISNTVSDKDETVGALRIRNSWGESWGEGGYGFLPYKYVISGLAVDWWSLLKAKWVQDGAFGLST